jgi:poly(3-hydroxyalkanoate) depolymerase
MERCRIGIVVFDVPGTGSSSAAAVPYRLSWLARLANDVLKSLCIPGQVDVGVRELGRRAGPRVRASLPARVQRLFLTATSAGAVSVPGRLVTLSKMLDARRYADPDSFAHIGGELYGGKVRGNAMLLKQHGEFLRSPRATGYYFQLLAVAGWTSAHRLHRLRHPTLVMMGADDPIVPVVNGRLLATLIPNARLVTTADGHLFLITSAREVAPIIATFLNQQALVSDSESAA